MCGNPDCPICGPFVREKLGKPDPQPAAYKAAQDPRPREYGPGIYGDHVKPDPTFPSGEKIPGAEKPGPFATKRDSDFVAVTALRSLNENFKAEERDEAYLFGFILQVLVQAYFEARRKPTDAARHTSPIRTLFAGAVAASEQCEKFPFPGTNEASRGKFPELQPSDPSKVGLDPGILEFVNRYPAVWPELHHFHERKAARGPFGAVNPFELLLRLLYGRPGR